MKVICTNYRECVKDGNIRKRTWHVESHDYDSANENVPWIIVRLQLKNVHV